MATTYPFGAQPDTFKGAPFVYGLDHILAAGGLIAAIGTKQWRQKPLIYFDRKNKYLVYQ